jgi:hypothetical protein
MEKLIRSRAARITVALFLLGIGLWAFAPYLFHRISSAAFVNAELLRVTSPIQGQLTTALPQRGEFVASATPLSLVNSPTPDRRQLAIYEQEQNAAVTRIKLAVAQIKALNESDRELGTRIDSYRHAMLDRLGREMEEAKANLRACDARREELTKQRARIDLGETGSVSSNVSKRSVGEYDRDANCEAATARPTPGQRHQRGEARHLPAGQLNDTPIRSNSAPLMLRKLELRLTASASRRASSNSSDIANERQRVERTSLMSSSCPLDMWCDHHSRQVPGWWKANDLIWPTASAASSSSNCRSTILIRQTRRTASVRLLGSNNWMSSTILRVLIGRAPGRALLTAKVLVCGTRRHRRGRPGVRLSIDRHWRYCDIGRMAEVHIERNRLDPLKLLDRITQSLGLSSIGTQVADESLEP